MINTFVSNFEGTNNPVLSMPLGAPLTTPRPSTNHANAPLSRNKNKPSTSKFKTEALQRPWPSFGYALIDTLNGPRVIYPTLVGNKRTDGKPNPTPAPFVQPPSGPLPVMPPQLDFYSYFDECMSVRTTPWPASDLNLFALGYPAPDITAKLGKYNSKYFGYDEYNRNTNKN